MERLTEYHSGVAVIKDKNKHKEAMKKLAEYENTGLTPEEIMDGKLLTGWISISERMPDEHEECKDIIDPYTFAVKDTQHHTASDLVQVTVKDLDKDELFVCDECTVDGKWSSFESEGFEVIAWMPLPEPYKPEEVHNVD